MPVSFFVLPFHGVPIPLRERRFHEEFPVTSFLLLFNAAFFLLEVIQHLKITGHLPQALTAGGIHPEVTDLLGSLGWTGIERGEYWRLVASAFLHGGVIHIFMNAWVLSDLGRLCEPLLSSWKFLVVYGVSTLGGAAGSLLGHWLRGEHAQSVGASGALCGLIGMLLVYSVRERQPELRNGLLRWIVWIAALSFFIPGIDNAGHVGGFIAGAAMGFTVKDYMTSRHAPYWRYPGYATLVAGIVCLGLSVWHYFEHR